MNSMLQRTRSVWMAEKPDAPPSLSSNLQTDVVIVGAGLGGLTTAYLLAREGRQVVVDSGSAGGGMTARTTAHLTCALDDRWHEMISLRGEDDARVAADAHRGAIDLVERIAAEGRIDCDFARVDGYLVPVSDKDGDMLEKEREAAQRVGLRGVRLESGSPFESYRATACLRFPNQARFHPLKYLRGLVAGIEAAGGKVFTAHATSAEGGERAIVKLDDKHEIRANAVVVATNTPINDRVMVHTKQAPYRSYVIAGHVPSGSIPDALLWDTGWPYHYVRIQPAGERDVLIVGGEDHKTGQADDMVDRLHRLETWARERFPMLERVMWRWSGQVMESVDYLDYLGYLGRNPGKDKNVYIITGDSGQGMTHCTIGARIIADEIAGRENAWSKLFDPSRISLKAGATYARENLNVVGQMADHVTAGDVSSVDDIAAGSGAIVRSGAHKLAAYRDADGQLSVHSAVCPHMGCVVAWNPFEGCFDCPCHGSQFSATGEIINGPAVGGLPEAKDAPGEHRHQERKSAENTRPPK